MRTRSIVGSLGVVACLICAASTNGHAAPPGPTAAQQKPQPHVVAEKVVQAKTQQYVTWSFVKVNQPRVAAAALKDAQSGKIRKEALTGFASPAALSELLKTNWANVPTDGPPTTATNGATPPPRSWHLMTTTQPTMSVASLVDLSSAALSYSVFGSGSPTQSTSGESPTDGTVTATISGSSDFRIVKIVDYDGTVSGGQGAVTLNDYEHRDAAPFQLAMHAGQRFKVIVAFDVKVGAAAGTVKGSLDLKGIGWSKSVVLTGDIKGINGSINVSPGHDVHVVTDPSSNDKIEIDVPMIFKNDSQAFTGQLSAHTMPAGVTIRGGSASFSMTAKETKTINVPLAITPSAITHGWHDFSVDMKVPGWTAVLIDSFDALPGITRWTYSDSNTVPNIEQTQVNIDMSLTLGASGVNYFESNVVFDRGLAFFTARSTGATVRGAKWSGGGDGATIVVPTWSAGGTSGWNAYLGSKPSFSYSYTYVNPVWPF